MPQLIFAVCLTGLLILMLFMVSAIYFEGTPFDRLPTLNDDRGLKWVPTMKQLHARDTLPTYRSSA